MDLQTLQFFRLACEGLNITKIAEENHISRQAVSQSLVRLEEEFGAQLFLRQRRGISPTKEGLILYKHVSVIMDNWEQAKTEICRFGQSPAVILRAGYGQMTYNLWPSHHSADFNASHPDFKIDSYIDVPDNLYSALSEGRCDLIVTNSKDKNHGFCRELIVRRPAVLVVSAADFPDRPDVLRPEQLSGLCLVTIPGNKRFNAGIKQYFEEKGIRCASITAGTNEITGLLRELSEGSHCFYASSGIFTDLVIMPEGLFTAKLVGDGVPNKDVYAVWRKDSPFEKEILEYTAYLKTYFIPER